jgi:hypothetical protein
MPENSADDHSPTPSLAPEIRAIVLALARMMARQHHREEIEARAAARKESQQPIEPE